MDTITSAIQSHSGGGLSYDGLKSWCAVNADIASKLVVLLAVALVFLIAVTYYQTPAKDKMTSGEVCGAYADPTAEAEARALYQLGALRFGSAACGSAVSEMIDGAAGSNPGIRHRAEQRLRRIAGAAPQPVLLPKPVGRLSEEHTKALLEESGTRV